MPSLVWDYFKVCPQDKKLAICNECKKSVSRGGSKTSAFNTSNLIVHLSKNHKEVHDDYLRKMEDKGAAKSSAPLSQMTIKDSSEKKVKYNKNHPRAKAITRKIMECIALDNQPFSIVRDIGFRRLVMYLEPRYPMPDRRYLSEEALPELYGAVSNEVAKLLSDAVFISFTTDIWSSGVNQVSMLSLTAQWLDEDFVMRKVVLHSQECRGSHTYDAISSAFEGMFEKWEIPKEKAHVVVRDNARNMAKATVEFGVASLPCMAHTLQLAIKGGALSQRSISEALSVGRQLVGHFKHSPLASGRLEDVQPKLNMKPKKLQQDVTTRWNSTYYMMNSLLEQKNALGSYATDFDLPAMLTASQWGIMDKMTNILKPFQEITKQISCAKATAADVIPTVVSLTRLLAKKDDSDKGVKEAKRILLEAVRDRFKDAQSEPLYVIATMVDARFKDRYFDMGKKEAARNLLLQVVGEMAGNEQREAADAQGDPACVKGEVDGSDQEESDQDDCPPKKAKIASLEDMYLEILEENEVTEQATAGQTAQEVHAYLGEPIIKIKACPFEYWRVTQSRFPSIARVARKYLSAPCTSVDSERLFSAVANIIDEKRNRLHPENAEMLVFIQKNLLLTVCEGDLALSVEEDTGEKV